MEFPVTVLSASPHKNGATRTFANRLVESLEVHDVHVRLLDLTEVRRLRACVGCGYCNKSGKCIFEANERASEPVSGFSALYDALEQTQMLVIVAPVYFAGPPALYKAFLDRMQPFWVQRYMLQTRPPLLHSQRKPLILAVQGGGGDPFGYEPLVTCTKSAMRMLNFELQAVVDCIRQDHGDQENLPGLLQTQQAVLDILNSTLPAEEETYE